MNKEPTTSDGLHPVIPTPEELRLSVPDEVGDEEYVELRKMIRLEAAIDFAITVKLCTTYKPVGLVSGWFWRDAKFHAALGVVSEKAIARGEGAKSAVVCRAAGDGTPTRPGRQFYEMVERARKITIHRLPDGEYVPEEAEKVWIGEMTRLGFGAADLGLPTAGAAASAAPLSRAAEWMLNRLALDYRQADYPPEWTYPLKRNPTAAELAAHGLIKELGTTASAGYTLWCFTEKGQQQALALTS